MLADRGYDCWELIDYIYENGEESTIPLKKKAESQDKSYFDFIKTHDSSILTQIKKYTPEVKDRDFSKLDEVQTEFMIEELVIDLTDTITRANFKYLKSGMKLGVRMLFELMA